jgi:hypothetical protein
MVQALASASAYQKALVEKRLNHEGHEEDPEWFSSWPSMVQALASASAHQKALVEKRLNQGGHEEDQGGFPSTPSKFELQTSNAGPDHQTSDLEEPSSRSGAV